MHDWWGQVAALVIGVGLPFGPAIYLAWRHYRDQPITREALIGVLVWTLFMLVATTFREHGAREHLKEACMELKRELVSRLHDDDAVWDQLPSGCTPEDDEPDQ